MPLFLAVDWAKAFLPSTSMLETFVRGTAMYLALIILLRVVLKREAGTLSITDLLMIVLLGDAAQNGMAANETSVIDGLVLIATILFWNYTLDFLAYHIPLVERWLTPPPLLLVRDGQLLRRNMRRELITQDELLSQLRQQGAHSLEDVKVAYMEGDGRISVITHEHEHPKPRRDAH